MLLQMRFHRQVKTDLKIKVMKILIDNGHGEETPGKRSPDGLFREYKYARQIAEEVVKQLQAKGYDAQRIVTEDNDVSLAERCKRVNAICDKVGAGNVILVSVHVDAAGNGQWMKASGWSAFTSRGQTKADVLADSLYDAAKKILSGKKIRTDFSDKDPDFEAGFYILKHTKCPAVLTENFFQDNKDDVSWLLSLEGKNAIVKVHVEGIINYIKEHGK